MQRNTTLTYLMEGVSTNMNNKISIAPEISATPFGLFNINAKPQGPAILLV
jgi:hypothetical protein